MVSVHHCKLSERIADCMQVERIHVHVGRGRAVKSQEIEEEIDASVVSISSVTCDTADRFLGGGGEGE